jgi:hypothetical protein
MVPGTNLQRQGGAMDLALNVGVETLISILPLPNDQYCRGSSSNNSNERERHN